MAKRKHDAEVDNDHDTDETGNGKPQTKRQRRRAGVSDPGADDKPRGVVKTIGRELMWLNNDDQWEAAVYHHEIRQPLIDHASHQGRDQYDHLRVGGNDPTDITSFLESQRHWNSQRPHWDTIHNNILLRITSRDHQNPQYPIHNLKWEGKTVLDLDSHPVRDFADLPFTLSSQLEGWYMEAMSRIEPRIEKTDFRARMPRFITTKQGVQKGLATLSALGNREMRFRGDNGLTCWRPRTGSDVYNKAIIDKLSPEEIANNMISNLDWTKADRAKASKLNQGKMMSRAGNRLLDDNERKAREDKAKQFKKRKREQQSPSSHSDSHGSDQSDEVDEAANDSGDSYKPKSKRHKAQPASRRHGGKSVSKYGGKTVPGYGRKTVPGYGGKTLPGPGGKTIIPPGINFGSKTIPLPSEDAEADEPEVEEKDLETSDNELPDKQGEDGGDEENGSDDAVGEVDGEAGVEIEDEIEDGVEDGDLVQVGDEIDSDLASDSEIVLVDDHDAQDGSEHISSDTLVNTQLSSLDSNDSTAVEPIAPTTQSQVDPKSNDDVAPLVATAEAPAIEYEDDYRYFVPNDYHENRLVHEALQPTLAHLHTLLGEGYALQTDYFSYAEQYVHLQRKLVEETSSFKFVDDLRHYEAWTGGFDKFTNAAITESPFMMQEWNINELGVGEKALDDVPAGEFAEHMQAVEASRREDGASPGADMGLSSTDLGLDAELFPGAGFELDNTLLAEFQDETHVSANTNTTRHTDMVYVPVVGHPSDPTDDGAWQEFIDPDVLEQFDNDSLEISGPAGSSQ